MICQFIHLFIIYSHLERMHRHPCACYEYTCRLVPHQITHELLIELKPSDAYRQQEGHLSLEGEHLMKSLQGMTPIRYEH